LTRRPLKLTWRQALAWRLGRQLLDPVGSLPVEEVVRRLCGVQAQVASSAEFAIRVRRTDSSAGEVAQALADGGLIKTWANRGTLHLLTPEDGGAILSLVAAGRSWELPSWQRYFNITPKSIEQLRAATREVLADGGLTREELIDAVVRRPGLAHLEKELRSGWGTLLKPLAWQGDLVYGPSRGTRVTFMLPEQASKRWRRLPDADDAGPRVARAYLGAYGPATLDNFRSWLSRPSRRQLRQWFEAAGDVVEVDIEGTSAFVRAEDVDELAAAKRTDSVRLVGGFDQWVLGPGTADTNVIPPGRRAAVSKQSGWIAPLIIVGGVVGGTWELDGDVVRIGWFSEIKQPALARLESEVERVSVVVGRSLTAEVTIT